MSIISSAAGAQPETPAEKALFLRTIQRLGSTAETDIRLLADVLGNAVVPKRSRSALTVTVESYSANPYGADSRIARRLFYRYGHTASGGYVAVIRLELDTTLACIRPDELIAELGPSFEALAANAPHAPPRPAPTSVWAMRYTLPSGARAVFSFRYAECLPYVVVFANI
ncbi:MAG TPA: hypothetical protein VED01_13670 [Burkholderiales bacterium]|nr:hypothetical protein [Burkholderiales bacterium]